MALALPRTGSEREDRAAEAGAAIGAAFAAAELAILAALARAIRHAVIAGTAGAGKPRLMRFAAALIAGAQAKSLLAVRAAGFDPVPPVIATAITSAGRTAYKTTGNLYTAAVKGALTPTGSVPGLVSLAWARAAALAISEAAAKGITGYTDTLGRNWDVASYAEMATRTAISNAFDDALTDAIQASGSDLVLVGTTSPEGTCPKCLPYLGRLLSITGEDPGYTTLAQAKARGFRHPNCRCTLTPESDPVEENVNPAREAAEYAASQQLRALQRTARVAQRRAQTAGSPAARTQARRDLAAARAAVAQFQAP